MPNIQKFDVIVIGGGQGAALARKLCEGGKKVALIEKDQLGGSCVNRGCTPTKAHIASAKRAHDARTARELGVYVDEVRVNLAAVVARSDELIRSSRQDIADRLQNCPRLELLEGTARFAGPNRVGISGGDVPSREIEAGEIVVATGTRSQIPDIEGLDQIDWLDNGSALELKVLPEKLLVLGGGYIACEFAQMFRRFGSEVVIAQQGKHLLEREDEDVSNAIAQLLRDEHIEVHLDCEAKSFKKTDEGLECHFADGSVTSATHLLLAIGQQPNTDTLNVEVAGLRLDEKGFVETDEFLSAAPGVWAMGDVKGGPAFTHIAFDDVRILTDVLLEGKRRSIKDRSVPYCVFTDPQLGCIGMTEREAMGAGYEVRVAKIPVFETARGLETGESKGFLKAIVDAETGLILGGAMLCRDGGELMAVLQVAMEAELPYQKLREGVFAHPTFAEALNNLFIAMDKESLKESSHDCLK